jgi:hypothetical protein
MSSVGHGYLEVSVGGGGHHRRRTRSTVSRWPGKIEELAIGVHLWLDRWALLCPRRSRGRIEGRGRGGDSVYPAELVVTTTWVAVVEWRRQHGTLSLAHELHVGGVRMER